MPKIEIGENGVFRISVGERFSDWTPYTIPAFLKGGEFDYIGFSPYYSFGENDKYVLFKVNKIGEF